MSSLVWPPKPEEYGRLLAKAEILEATLRKLVDTAGPCLPDRAPFDMDRAHFALAMALDAAGNLLARYAPRKPVDVEGSEDLAGMEEREAEYEREQRRWGR